jgi:hypothetical protein
LEAQEGLEVPLVAELLALPLELMGVGFVGSMGLLCPSFHLDRF